MSSGRANITATVKAEAAAWIARLHSDRRSRADEMAFREWIAASSEHAEAFDAITAVWDMAGALPYPVEVEHVGGMSLRRRSFLAGLATTVAAGALLSGWEVAYAGVYETEVGEQKHVALSDGTQVLLDSDTRIRERFNYATRQVYLERGRANFHVMPERRPFAVDADGQRIIATQTNFDVGRDGSVVSVVLLQGRALVLSSHKSKHGSRQLNQGERFIATSMDQPQVDRPNLAPLVAWQTGQAMFENETLAAAAREMNRYSNEKLEIVDPAIAGLRFSGVYRVGDNRAFARAVALLLPVEVQASAEHIELSLDRSRSPDG